MFSISKDLVTSVLVPVVQTMDRAINQISHYPLDKSKQNQLCYPVDSDLSGDSLIHLLNNWGLYFRPALCCVYTQAFTKVNINLLNPGTFVQCLYWLK